MRHFAFLGFAFLTALGATALADAPAIAGPGFPSGWGGGGKGYEVGTGAMEGAGAEAFYVRALPEAASRGFGTMTRCIAADDYRGRRLRLSARLRSVDAQTEQLWMRVDGPDKKGLRFYNMDDRPIRGTTGWKDYIVVLDVPAQSTRICYGFFLSGDRGEAWADGLALEPVANDVALSIAPALEASGVAQTRPLAADLGRGWHMTRGMLRPRRLAMGMGTVEGMTGRQAIYLAGDAGWATARNSQARYGALERDIPLADWRGQRVRLSLRLRNDGDARVWAALQIGQRGNSVINASRQDNEHEGEWETHMFVLDVPNDATDLFLNVGLTGSGRIWVDELTLAAVGADVPATDSWQVIFSPYRPNSWLDNPYYY